MAFVLFFHLAAAAFLAIIFRRRADKDSARALPPLDAPSFDSATAAGFRVSSGGFSRGVPSKLSRIACSTTERATVAKSRSLPLLAREGMV